MTHVKKITYFALAFLYHVEKVVFFLLQDFFKPHYYQLTLQKKHEMTQRNKDNAFLFFFHYLLYSFPKMNAPNYVEISSWKICQVISSSTKLVHLKGDIWWLLIKEKHLFKRILKFFVLESYSIYSNSYIPR